jgi:hypothetical protein
MANPADQIVRGARAYVNQSGVDAPVTDHRNAIMTEPAASKIAQAYDRMPAYSPEAVPAFQQMARETERQFDFMTKPRRRGGLGIEVQVQEEDPYAKFQELQHDVLNNHRVKVVSTSVHGGHPVFTNDQNDMFRAVHDTFGHIGAQRGFDFDGEEGAFQKHAAMYSPLARRAMATETRGQNAALRATGDFQEQKVGLLPEHMQGLQFSRTGGPLAVQAALQRRMMKNREQGI